MEIVEIEEKAEYIKELFEKEKYDSFYLYEARVKTKLDYYVNGRLPSMQNFPRQQAHRSPTSRMQRLAVTQRPEGQPMSTEKRSGMV